jgi:hypothetical protein
LTPGERIGHQDFNHHRVGHDDWCVGSPDRAECTCPSDDGVVVHTSSATLRACRAYRAAVAAAQHVAVQAALATIDRGFRATLLRARALSKHWLDGLRDELARINLALEEQDRAAAIRPRLVELGQGSTNGGAQLRGRPGVPLSMAP